MLTCVDCGAVFSLSEDRRKRYPGWKPKQCPACYKRAKARPELNLTTEEVLETFSGGPDTGIFTDGSCERNPDGPGGWGVVKVIENRVIAQRHGHAEVTTNNRMELTALIEAFGMLAVHEEFVVYTDSKYCQNIATKWANAWKRNGWTRGKKREEVQNLDLVRELHELVQTHPRTRVEWAKGHNGWRWNEYADSLSTAYARG